MNRYLNIKKRKNRNHGFTLIELLAVIIILGVLMIIAIPSVTEYIQSSRKNAYITTATQYISGARNKINSSEIPMYDTEATYYLPASCISLEKGGNSPFGEWVDAYIVVTYDGFGYDYYWTSRDSSNMGILLTDEKLLNESRVQAGITSISTEVGIDEKDKILIINNCDGNDLIEKSAREVIEKDSLLEENVVDDGSIGLYQTIIKDSMVDNIQSTYVSSPTGINFATSSSDTNGKGIYIRSGTENNKYPIYYYRGNVMNNNVIFAGFCWQIVRTTETGGIKLVYNGQPTDGACISYGTASHIGVTSYSKDETDNAYIGYMTGNPGSESYEETHKNIYDSQIKETIDEWYKANIDEKGFTEKLEDTIWCNDRSFARDNTGSGTGISDTYYAPSRRIESTSVVPILSCSNVNDRFTVNKNNGNGNLKYPVALLTADEATLAGNGYKGYSAQTYLNIAEPWWTLTPSRTYNGMPFEYYVGSSGHLDETFGYIFPLQQARGIVKTDIGIRPSVSLKARTRYIKGDGTVYNPYIVK